MFQFIDSNNFCINTFWIGAIPWALYISGGATFKAGPWTPWPLIQSLSYGTNPKSVNTKVVAITKLKHIVIGSFCLNWIFLSFSDTCILHYGTSNSAMILRFWEYLRSFWRYHYNFFAKSSSFYALSAFRTFRCNPKPTKHHSSGPFIARTTFFRHFFRKNGFSPKPLEIFPIYFFCFIPWERHFKSFQTTWYPRLIV